MSHTNHSHPHDQEQPSSCMWNPSDGTQNYVAKAIAGVITGCILGVIAFLLTLYCVCRFTPRHWRFRVMLMRSLRARNNNNNRFDTGTNEELEGGGGFNTDTTLGETPPRRTTMRAPTQPSQGSIGGAGTMGGEAERREVDVMTSA
ncbi:hypothetical protein Micbo1qcDRAFT_206220 [Microdochium bolleyi]|uniref:Uncharacterized protein n=1 Tax=Microdochium bolleyi TaxID=196109 RepID=A0A136IWY5_9PEZI|nr:hypothetical protein Micbo1qcDRAFT_206220 [Microdochium bolleyi]